MGGPLAVIVVLGAGGMLGSAVCRALRAQRIDHVAHTHDTLELLNPEMTLKALAGASVIINCAGAIEATRNQYISTNVFAPVMAAQAAPRATFVHVSADCVSTRPVEREGLEPVARPIPPRLRPEKPDSLYARSKILAERYLYGRAVIVRTAFVGERQGLLRWFIDLPWQATVTGWDRVFWSGSHIDAVADRLAQMADDPPRPGIYHLATSTPVTKFDVLETLQRAYRRQDVVIRRGIWPEMDRSLEPTGEPLPSLDEWFLRNPPSNQPSRRGVVTA